MDFVRKTNGDDEHVYIPELKDLFRRGRISRREFLRNATLLGMTLSGASAFLAACGPASQPTQSPASTQAPAKTGPVRGGSLKVASRVQKVTHPAQFSWVSPSNQLRQVAEYLTCYGVDNVARPLLLKDWQSQ